MATSLTILGPRRAAHSLNDRLVAIRDELLALDEITSARLFDLSDFDALLKSTISLCPDCLGHVPAIIYTRGGRVLMTKRCATHGISHALIESDVDFYYLSNKDRWGKRFAKGNAG